MRKPKNLSGLSMKIGLITFVLGSLPIFSVLLASMLATMLNCEVHEGFANDCIILGINIGEFLYVMFVAGWFMLLTFPVMFLGIALMGLGALVKLVSFLRDKRAQR